MKKLTTIWLLLLTALVILITLYVASELRHKDRMEQCELALDGWQRMKPAEITFEDYWGVTTGTDNYVAIFSSSEQPVMFRSYAKAMGWAHWADICRECVIQGYLDEGDLYE